MEKNKPCWRLAHEWQQIDWGKKCKLNSLTKSLKSDLYDFDMMQIIEAEFFRKSLPQLSWITKFQGSVLSIQFSNILLYNEKEDITQVEVFPTFFSLFFFHHSHISFLPRGGWDCVKGGILQYHMNTSCCI